MHKKIIYHITGLPRSGKDVCKMKLFPGQGKSGNFVDGQGNLERPWKVREKSGNLKINGCGKQTSEGVHLFFFKCKNYSLSKLRNS